ncbi:GSCOCG00002803001-RA-CDS, partial [Cotesia congregata]
LNSSFGLQKHFFTCEVCYKKFTDQANFRRHRKFSCKDASRKFECEKCHKKFRRQDNLRIHLISCNKVKNQFHCPKCDATFRCKIQEMNYFLYPELNYQRDELEILRPKKLRLHYCSGCGRSYTRVDSLKRHQLKCNEYLMTSLQDSGAGRNDDREYFCENCGKGYRRRDSLLRHQR